MTAPSTHPLMASRDITIVPGVYDVLSARMARAVGFHGAVLTGYGVSASYLGEPDFGLLTQTEILDTARRILRRVDIRLMVDGDTGFGGPINVQRMVGELVDMGAFGILLEDQTWPKRCGHMRGKDVIDAEEHAAKIRAAADARGDAPFVNHGAHRRHRHAWARRGDPSGAAVQGGGRDRPLRRGAAQSRRDPTHR